MIAGRAFNEDGVIPVNVIQPFTSLIQAAVEQGTDNQQAFLDLFREELKPLVERKGFFQFNVGTPQEIQNKEIASVLMIEAPLFEQFKIELIKNAGEFAGEVEESLTRAQQFVQGILSSDMFREIEGKYFGDKGLVNDASKRLRNTLNITSENIDLDIVPNPDLYTQVDSLEAFKESLDAIRKGTTALQSQMSESNQLKFSHR